MSLSERGHDHSSSSSSSNDDALQLQHYQDQRHHDDDDQQQQDGGKISSSDSVTHSPRVVRRAVVPCYSSNEVAARDASNEFNRTRTQWVRQPQASGRFDRFRRFFQRGASEVVPPSANGVRNASNAKEPPSLRLPDLPSRPPHQHPHHDPPVIESGTPVSVGRLRTRGQALRVADRRQRQREAERRRELVEKRYAVITIPTGVEAAEDNADDDLASDAGLGTSAYRRTASQQRRYSTVMLPESEVPPHLLHSFIGVAEGCHAADDGGPDSSRSSDKQQHQQAPEQQLTLSSTQHTDLAAAAGAFASSFDGHDTSRSSKDLGKRDSRYFEFDFRPVPPRIGNRGFFHRQQTTAGGGLALRHGRQMKRVVRMGAWMQDARLQRMRVWDICFPGTHNSASWALADNYRRRWSSMVTSFLRLFIHCQQADIYEQLCLGIRFLDLRVCKHIGRNGEPFCAHGGFRTVPFRLVLEQVASFCHSHPTEVVLMSVRRDVAYRHGPASIGVLESDFWVAALLKAYLGRQLEATTTIGELIARQQQVIYFFEERERYLPTEQPAVMMVTNAAKSSADARRAVAQSLRAAGELSVTGRDVLRTVGEEPDPCPLMSPMDSQTGRPTPRRRRSVVATLVSPNHRASSHRSTRTVGFTAAAGGEEKGVVDLDKRVQVAGPAAPEAVLAETEQVEPPPATTPTGSTSHEPLQHLVTRWITENLSKFGLESLDQLPDSLFHDLFGHTAQRCSPEVQRRWDALHSGLPIHEPPVEDDREKAQHLSLPPEIFSHRQSTKLSSRRSSLRSRLSAAEVARTMMGRKVLRRHTLPRRTQQDPVTGVLAIAVSAACNARLVSRALKEERKCPPLRRCDSQAFVSGRNLRYLSTETAMSHRHDISSKESHRKKKKRKKSSAPHAGAAGALKPFPLADTMRWDASGRREFVADTNSAFIESTAGIMGTTGAAASAAATPSAMSPASSCTARAAKVLPRPPIASPIVHRHPTLVRRPSATLDTSEETAALPAIPAVRALGALLRCDSQLDASITEMLRSHGVTADAVAAPKAPEVTKRCISLPDFRHFEAVSRHPLERAHTWHMQHVISDATAAQPPLPCHSSFASGAGATQPLSQVEYDLQKEKLEQQRRVFLQQTELKEKLALDLSDLRPADDEEDDRRRHAPAAAVTPSVHGRQQQQQQHSDRPAPLSSRGRVASARLPEGLLRAPLPPLDVLTPFVAGRTRILKSWGQTTDPDPVLLCRKLAMWTNENGEEAPREPFIFRVLAGEVTPPSFGSPDGSIDVLRFWTMQGASALMLKNGGLKAAAEKTHRILLAKVLTRSTVCRVNCLTHDYVNENVVSRIIKHNMVATISRDELESLKRRHTETQ